jgi:hypothetical protein
LAICKKVHQSKGYRSRCLRWAKIRAQQHGDSPPDIDLPFLLRLWERQRGRCYLTGMPLCTQARHPLMITLDRKNPNRPYTKRNTGIAARWANAAKGEFTVTEFHRRRRRNAVCIGVTPHPLQNFLATSCALGRVAVGCSPRRYTTWRSS